MGMAMAGPMLSPGGVGGVGGAPHGSPAAPPPLPSWHIAENGAAVGPFSPPQLSEAVALGRLRADTLVWRSGMSGWSPAGQVPELVALFQAAPPPLPTG
jgi:hypothetical protein